MPPFFLNAWAISTIKRTQLKFCFRQPVLNVKIEPSEQSLLWLHIVALTFLNVSLFRFNRSISRIIYFINNYCVYKLMTNKNIQHEKNSKSKIVLSTVRAWRFITKVGILLYCQRLQTCYTHVHVKHYCIPFVWRRSARQCRKPMWFI